MTPSEELDALMQAVVDGQLSEADQLHLAVLLRDDQEAQTRYLDYMLLDSMLSWENPAVPQQKPSAIVTIRRVGLVLAACLLVAAGLGVLWGVFGRGEDGRDLVDRLADWSLAIADAPTPDDRERCYREQAEAFTAEVARADIPAGDRGLATTLLATARTLSAESSPLDEAEQLDEAAEQMLDWMTVHAESDTRRSRTMDRHYLRLVERSEAKLRRASAGTADEVKKKRMRRLHHRIGRRTDARINREFERRRHKRRR